MPKQWRPEIRVVLDVNYPTLKALKANATNIRQLKKYLVSNYRMFAVKPGKISGSNIKIWPLPKRKPRVPRRR
jgi:hypothetical protein